MKTRIFLVALFVAVALVAIACGNSASDTTQPSSPAPAPQRSSPMSTQTHAGVPAHFEDASSIGTLGPTLAPEQFIGPAQQAYQIAREIPQTLAQLPCYCHCDKNMGHKSLHSCFEDLHASHCDICITEALMADNLQKIGLTPAQIRERIITIYSSSSH